MQVLVIIPAYNEAEAIVSTAESIIDRGYDYIIINDGSRDDTLAICREHGLNVLDLPQNLGIGGAVQAGHKYACRHGYDVDIQFDGDGQHDAAFIDDLVAEIASGKDLAIGSRYLDATDGFQSTFMRRLGKTLISNAIRLCTGVEVTDPTSGFRACGKRAIKLFCDDYPVDYPEPESIVNAVGHNLEVGEVSVVMHERKGGESSIGAIASVYYMVKVTIAIFITALTSKNGKA